MNKIEEIALRVAEQIEPRGRTYSPDHYVDVVKLVLAELSKDVVPPAWTNLIEYVLQDDLHNRLTPRVVDIAYTAFMLAKQPNSEDGGNSDWFNDTKPSVMKAIAKLRKDLVEFTIPPNTADIEQRVAEACAKSSEAYGESLNNDWNKGLGVADDLLAWPTSAPKQSAPDSGGNSYKSP